MVQAPLGNFSPANMIHSFKLTKRCQGYWWCLGVYSARQDLLSQLLHITLTSLVRKTAVRECGRDRLVFLQLWRHSCHHSDFQKSSWRLITLIYSYCFQWAEKGWQVNLFNPFLSHYNSTDFWQTKYKKKSQIIFIWLVNLRLWVALCVVISLLYSFPTV